VKDADFLADLKSRLRAESGCDAIRHEAWVIATFGPAGLFKMLLDSGTFMGPHKRRLNPPAERRCHEAAQQLGSRGVGDWWLGLALGNVDREWCWFVHSWLTERGTSAEPLELTTSTPRMYFGSSVGQLWPALQAALMQDPPPE